MNDLSLRNANLDDAQFILDIANDPLTRTMSFNQKTISFIEHTEWFAKQLAEQNPFYIAEIEEKACGYVRFDISKQVPVISIAVHKDFRNQGIGKQLLLISCKLFFSTENFDTVYAYIKHENISSQKVFQLAGFYEILSSDSRSILMEYKR